MNEEYAVILKNVSKEYALYRNQKDGLRDLFRSKSKAKTYMALKEINLQIKQGEIIGIVGLNGAGKSTLSSLVAQVSYPTTGMVEVKGSVAMLSAQSGLNLNLSGLQNIEYKCILMGLSKKKIQEIKQEIIEFAEIGDFIYQPLKTYSSGMRARIGFAISVFLDPDVLIIDEGLAVGDSSFTDRCFEKIEEFRSKGKTIIYISHSVSSMQGFCDRVLWLHKGEIIAVGETSEILKQYTGFTKYYNSLTKENRDMYKPTLENFKVEHIEAEINNEECDIQIKASPANRCLYAFELFKNRERIYKIEYTHTPNFKYTFKENGSYRVKYYVRFEDKTIRGFVEWSNKKDTFDIIDK